MLHLALTAILATALAHAPLSAAEQPAIRTTEGVVEIASIDVQIKLLANDGAAAETFSLGSVFATVAALKDEVAALKAVRAAPFGVWILLAAAAQSARLSRRAGPRARYSQLYA